MNRRREGWWYSLDPAREKFFQEIRKKFRRPPAEAEPSAEAVCPGHQMESLHQGWLGERARVDRSAGGR